MTQAIRLVFDDCLSKHATTKLCELVKFGRAPVEIAHLAQLDCEGFIDDKWIPEIAQKGFLVITTDRGKKASRGGKLPILCRKHKVSFVMMSAAVHNLDQFGKMRAVLCVWPKILKAFAGPLGSGYLLRKTNEHNFDLVPCRASRDEPDERGRTQMRLPLPDPRATPQA